MAKTSAIQRNLKRIKMSKKFDKRRKKLKEIIRNKIILYIFKKKKL